MNSSMAGRDVFMRYTTAEGATYVAQHRCWNADLFEAACADEASRLAIEPLKNGKPAGKNKAERITEDQFHNERKA